MIELKAARVMNLEKVDYNFIRKYLLITQFYENNNSCKTKAYFKKQ